MSNLNDIIYDYAEGCCKLYNACWRKFVKNQKPNYYRPSAILK